MTALPFLRVPPFPGARPSAGGAVEARAVAGKQVEALAAEIVRLRVGGAFWGAQPALPPGRDVLLMPATQAMAAEMAASAAATGLASRAIAAAPAAWFAGTAIPCCDPQADPWHLVDAVASVWAGGDDERALIAALKGHMLRVFAPGRFAALGSGGAAPDRIAVLGCLAEVLALPANPFTGAPWPLAEAIAQFGDWRALIDDNRGVGAIYGIARWKRATLDALLWDGGALRYASEVTPDLATGDRVLAWTSRVPRWTLASLSARGVQVGEIEDGMIRSQGLGANCVPPLSVIVDRAGVHFDPSRPSTLEGILADTDFPPPLLDRAARLRERLVAGGLSKYGAAPHVPAPTTRAGGQRRVLVPGQVEDDRSVLTGGAGMTNLALLEAARALEPGAYITYRPHPDVEAGHRKGRVPDADALRLADAVERDGPVTAAIDAADALHVITSLAGFEALLRGKAVTTHGVPFYAGWGLTRDLGPVPERRGRQRTLDELVAAVLILYPRYLDPVTRLPCPVEILVERLAAGEAEIASPLIGLRKAQGALLRGARRIGTAR